jgi:putative flavoprotein involved in K+ transport
MPFEAKNDEYLGKDTVADYLEKYAEVNDLPIRSSTRVSRVGKDGETFVVEIGDRTLRSANVIVAMADAQVPHVPDFAPDLDPEIFQMHSSKYKRPSELADGPVLVVGLGNSGADIALELAQTHTTFVSGNPNGVIPFHIEPWFGRTIGVRIVKFAATKLLNTSTPIGRKARPKALGHPTAPLVRVKPKDLTKAGVKRVDRVTGVVDGRPQLEDGTVLDVANVVWCTGFRTGFVDWIDLPVFDDDGHPDHERGIAKDEPGLYFCGLFFLHSLWSETLVGMPIDAKYVVEHLSKRKSHVASRK